MIPVSCTLGYWVHACRTLLPVDPPLTLKLHVVMREAYPWDAYGMSQAVTHSNLKASIFRLWG